MELKVVKARSGSVLGRGMILKADHFETGNPNLEINLHGAPNFRMSELDVFGVAQPTIPGIKTILTLLKCHPTSNPIPDKEAKFALWISAREEPMVYLNRKPFIIRELKNALKNITAYHGIRTDRLEQMEERLKEDILREQKRWNGLILVHEERDQKTKESPSLVSNWMAIEHIQTPREVFENLKEAGYKVEYARIPISPEQAPEDGYIDEFLSKIRNLSINTPLIFNCGMGVGRTTCAMIIAFLIRRAQIIQQGGKDALSHLDLEVAGKRLETQKENKSMIELISLIETSFKLIDEKRSVVDWTMARLSILQDLKDVMNGKFQIVMQLSSLLRHGTKSKVLLDKAIDACAGLVNLRKSILMQRARYWMTGDIQYLSKSVGCLERYMFLLALCSFLEEDISSGSRLTSVDKERQFSSWLEEKPDVWNMLKRIKKTTPLLDLFRPLDDLSVYVEDRPDLAATELDKYVIRSRTGTVLVQNMILKEDFYAKTDATFDMLKGASNFRKIEGYPIYGVAQPTLKGVQNVLAKVAQDSSTILWINLREEPFVYLNGIPYVMRDNNVTLRNVKAFSGITSSAIEIIERKLKGDVVIEIGLYNGKILVHSESIDGAIVSGWKECEPSKVLSLKNAMDLVHEDMKDSNKFDLLYHRVPQTAESSPEASDLDELIDIFLSINLRNTAVIMNCQIGLGRSTFGTIVATLVMEWMAKNGIIEEPSPFISCSVSFVNYQVIHSLLRVIRNGIDSKRVVDQVIDVCGKYVNIRDSIEVYRQLYQSELDPVLKQELLVKGLLALDRYFNLILFQNYLEQNKPDSRLSFKAWVAMFPELKTIREELKGGNFDNPLVPVNEIEIGAGISMTDEATDVVHRRRGAVLAQGSIIKLDLFPGAQKMELEDRIQGAHNFRKVRISQCEVVAGVGMPTEDGIKATLDHLKAQGAVPVFWTSLREEPVVYIKGMPYVLRLLADPIRNLVATGITRSRVEEVEMTMKRDILQDMAHYKNRILLHEEKVEDSRYLVVPVWESVTEGDIKTPLEIYNSIKAQGYLVDYLRIPITDELAPIPDVFNQLVDRVLSTPSPAEPIFNCQMGRGRTTQGLVITVLMKKIVGHKGLPLMTFDDIPASEENGYKNGQYRLILQLMAVLQHGMRAKRLTDEAIDACAHMQNLREAIQDYRVRLGTMKNGTAKYKDTFLMGCNYLVRYFYLITFADYLIEVWAHWEVGQVKPDTFSSWLSRRREISNIIKFPHLD